MSRLRHRHLHRCRAVVRGIRLIRHRVRTRSVVVRPGRRRRRQLHRRTGASQCGKPRDRIRTDLQVGCRDRRVRRTVVAQRRRLRSSITRVPHRRRQHERRTSDGSAVAHRWRGHRQVGIALGLRHSGLRGLHRDLHRCRAVVRRVRLVGHRVRTRSVVVRPGRRGRCQLHRFAGASRCGKPRDRVLTDLRVSRRDGRVRRAVVPQRRRLRSSLTVVPHRRRQRETRTGGRAAVADRWRHHRQVRMSRRRHRHLHRCRAVVRRVRLVGHRVRTRSVVVRPGRRGRRQIRRRTGAPRCRKPRDRLRTDLRVSRRDGRVRRTVVPQRGRLRSSLTVVPHRRRHRERRTGGGIAVAHRWRGHRQVRMARLRHRHLHRCRAVVRGVRLIRHRVHARSVVVRPGRRRRRQIHRLAAGCRCGKLRHYVRAHFRVRSRDRRVRRAVVPQRRRLGSSLTVVPHCRRQRETRTGGRAAVADRWRGHQQVRMALRLGLQIRLRHRHLHRCRAVVRRVRLIGHRVHARSVVVRPGRRGRRQIHRLAAGCRCGKLRDRVRAHLRVGSRDRRIRRAVVAQCRRRRGSVTGVSDGRRQREPRTGFRAAIAHRRRRHHQVRGLPSDIDRAAAAREHTAHDCGEPDCDVRRAACVSASWAGAGGRLRATAHGC